MLDRSIPPIIHPIQEIVFPEVQYAKLDNGIPVYSLIGGSQEILKLDLVFDAGRINEESKLTAKACNHLLKEGTSNYNSERLAEEIDFYGSTISCQSGMDHAGITLYCLKKHFESSLNLLTQILEEATFPKEEIKKYGIRASEGLKQQLSKNSVVAYRKLSEEIFGKLHPYGYNTEPEDYLNINREKVLAHYHSLYTKDNCRIYISGSYSTDVLQKINASIGQFQRGPAQIKTFDPLVETKSQKLEIAGNKLQNSIKIGKKLFNRRNPDYYPFMMMNTVLGGYFGSRLMSSIREEKGYTYSIYSILDPLLHSGSFYISTEVGKEYYHPTIEAIFLEFEKLKNDAIGNSELDMAKNYMLGNFLSMLDGPLKTSKMLKMIIENGFEVKDFPNIIETVRSISSQEIQNLAQKYLDETEMFLISVGDF